ncbi:MAG: hypothetical protein U9Q07_04085 [Planctomycetota bacterium]|nr:hypothetical protein [Planctomycetota bacterium]
MKYVCDDGNAEIDIEADSAREAAQEYVDGGDWGMDEDDASTTWIDVRVWKCDENGQIVDEDESELVTITLQPPEPRCHDGEDHDWKRPEWLGGCKENPGVQGHGGGTRGTDVCRRCGCYRHWDGWAQRPDTGEQGLDSVRYTAADEQSEEWIAEGTAA